MEFQYEGAKLALRPHQGFWKLINLYSTYPRQGHATELMRIVTDYADRNHIRLVLEPKQYGDPRGMTTPQLFEFYKRFGFVTRGELMVRDSQELQGL